MRPWQAARVVVIALITVLGVACGGGTSTSRSSATTSATSAPSTAPPSTERSTSSPASVPTSTEPAPAAPPPPVGVTPARLVIERIGVDAPIIELDLDGTGTLEVPTDFDDTGWYRGGPAPGERGPAVIAGHVDSRSGPAVFHRLPELRAGDEVVITGVEGTTTTWVVERLESYPKDELPTIEVYGLTPGPELRLITCDGEFDAGTGRYVDNLIAYAKPA